MGRHCNYCNSIRPNERFSGRGHKIGLCMDCAKLPKETLRDIKDSAFLENVLLNQSNISKGNIKTLEEIAKKSVNLSEKANLISEIGRIFPHKKKRIAKLYQKRKDLFDKLVRYSLIEDFQGNQETEFEHSEA